MNNEIDEDRFGPVLISILIIIMLIGIGLYLYSVHHHNEYNQGGGHMMILVTNESQLPYTLYLPGNKTYELAPEKSTHVSISQHDTISVKAYNYDGTVISYNYTVANPEIQKLYVTNSGIRTNISGVENVRFLNNAPFPVIFIEKSKAGSRRWGTDIVAPYTASRGHFVGKRTTWEVAHPTSENTPLAQITVGGKVQRIIFDGYTLHSE